MKLLLTIFGFICLAGLNAQTTKNLRVEPEHKYVKYGEKVRLRAIFEIPAGDTPVYISGYTFEKTAPKALAEKIKPSGTLYQWKNVYHLKEEDRSGSFSFDFDTVPLMPGDYQIGMALRVFQGDPKQKEGYTIRCRFELAVTEPTAAPVELKCIDQNFRIPGTGKPASQPTSFQISNDAAGIYFKIKCMEPEIDKLRTGEGHSWNNDCVEISLMPPGAKSDDFYKLIINPDGRMDSYMFVDDNMTGKLVGKSWQFGGEIKTAVQKDHWSIDALIPFPTMQLADGGTWKYSIFRGRRLQNKQSEFSTNTMAAGTSDAKGFLPLELSPAFCADNFRWEVANTAGKVIYEAGKYYYQLNPTILNKSGEYRIFALRGKLYQGEKIVGESSSSGALLEGYSAKIPLPLPLAENGKYRLEADIVSPNGLVYHRINSDIEAALQPLLLKIQPPVLDNTIYDSMKCDRVKLEITDLTGQAETAEIELNGQKQSVKLDKGKALIELETGNLKPGDYPVKATSIQGEASLRLRKLPPRPGEVRLDENGIAYVDGKPFIPYGWGMFMQPGPGGYMYDDTFNQTIAFAQYSVSDWKTAKNLLDRAQKMNLKLVLSPYQYEREKTLFAARKGNLSPAQAEGIRNFVNQAKLHPAVFGWYLADEPEGANDNPEWFAQVRELINEIDPFHPCFMTNYQRSAVEKYQSGCNILLPDVYIHYHQDSLVSRYPIEIISDFTRFSNQFKPTWLWLQGYCCGRMDHPLCRPPNAVEFRNQVYQVFAADGKGIILYAFPYSQMYYPLRKMPAVVGAELKEIGPVILQPNQPRMIRVAGDGIMASLKQLGSKVCIIAINTRPEAAQAEIKVELPDLKQLHVLSEKRTVQIPDRTFTDSFGPYEVHVYLSELSSDLSLTDVYAEIDRLEKARFKPGNLICIGEQTKYNLKKFHKEGNPPELPRVFASSEWSNYYHRSTGTLNYLIDGMIEDKPHYAQQNWAPKPDDEKPWVKIDLPKTASIHKVILYTPEQRLETASLTIGANELGTANRNGGKLTFEFKPIKGKEVRVEILKTGGNPNFPLLTEIEVYGKYDEK